MVSSGQAVLPRAFKNPKAEEAYSESIKAIEKIDIKSIVTLKSFSSPPTKAFAVLAALIAVQKNKKVKDVSWNDCKVELANPSKFVAKTKQMSEYESLSAAQVKRIHEVAAEFDVEGVKKASTASASVLEFVQRLSEFIEAEKECDPGNLDDLQKMINDQEEAKK